MFESTKFKVLEIIIKNQNAGFNSVRVALMSGFPNMSWEEISSFVALLGEEGYVKNLYGDNELCYVAVQRSAFARLYGVRETVKSEKAKTIIEGILKLVSLS